MRQSLRTAVFAYIAFATVCAQSNCQDLRANAFGRVTRLDGTPWSGAEVHLVHRPHATLVDSRFTEHLVTTTDARGQFRTPVLVGCAYAAWAVGPTEGDGGYLATGVQSTAVARTPILLHEKRRQFVRRVRIRPHPSWQGHAIRYRAALEAHGGLPVSIWLEADADGVLTLPRWPSRYVSLQAWSEGWLVFRTALTVTEDYAVRYGLEFRSERPKPDGERAAAALAEIYDRKLPARRVVPITLLEAESEQPVEHATASTEFQPPSCPLPTSGADGILDMVVASDDPMPKDPATRMSLVAASHRERSLGVGARDEAPQRWCTLWPGQTAKVRLTLSDTPLKQAPVLLDSSVGSGPDGSWFGIEPRVLRSNATGEVRIRGRSARFPYRLSLPLTPAQRHALGGDEQWPVAPLAVLRWERPWQDGGNAEDFGTIDVAKLNALDIRVRQPDGTPPGSTRVLLIRSDVGDNAPSSPLTIYTDHRGRVRVFVDTCADVLVHAVTAQGAAWQRLTAEDRTLDLRIDPRHVTRFRMLDPDGSPLADAHVHLVCPDQHGTSVDEGVLKAVREMCMVNAFVRQGCRTDAHGFGTIVSPLLGTSLDFAVRHREADSKRVHLYWNGPEADDAGNHIVPEIIVR